MAENTDGSRPLVLRKPLQQLLRELHLQEKVAYPVRKAPCGGWLTVAVGNVGLDVKDGGAVHQIGAAHNQYITILPGMAHFQELYAGQSQIVGPERGAGGKYTHAGVAAQPGRADRWGPALPYCLGKLPDDPQVGVFFNAPQGIGIAVFRLENNDGLQCFHQTALPGDAEFAGEIGMHPGNHLD